MKRRDGLKVACGSDFIERMPFLEIATNVEVTAQIEGLLLKEASKTLASGTGKPEDYVMVRIKGSQLFLFAGTDAPAAFLEVKSIGYPDNGVQRLAGALSALVTTHLGVPENRTYVVFADVKAPMWAHGGETFG